MNNRKTNKVDIATQIVELALERVKPIDGIPISLILPHGTNQSVQEVIATGLKQFDGTSIDHIILIGIKSAPRNNKLVYIKNKGNFDTIVGALEIDRNLAEALAQTVPECNTQAPKKEFSEEFSPLFPFLKRVCPFAKILPILLAPNNIELGRKIGITLADMLKGKNAAMIVLSDLEDLTLTAIEYCDVEVLIQSIPLIQDHTETKANISFSSITAAVQFAQNTNSNTTTILKSAMTQSPGTKQNQYQASVMLYRYTPPDLVPAQEEELIHLAKASILNYIQTREIPAYKTEDPAFLRKSGVFVTIRQHKALRGCIGRLQSDLPLYKVVQEIAVAAATSDPRFPPIREEETDSLEFKIAILSPLRRINANEVKVGTHGLLIAHRGRRGVLLPDVPVERGWDRETFLANLCLKAGLPPQSWRENPTLYAFTTVEFGGN